MWLWLVWFSECSSGWPCIHSKHFSFLSVGIVCTTVPGTFGFIICGEIQNLISPSFNEYLKMVISLINVIYQPWSSISATDTIKCKKRKTGRKTESTDLAVDRVGLALGPEAHFTRTWLYVLAILHESAQMTAMAVVYRSCLTVEPLETFALSLFLGAVCLLVRVF